MTRELVTALQQQAQAGVGDACRRADAKTTPVLMSAHGSAASHQRMRGAGDPPGCGGEGGRPATRPQGGPAIAIHRHRAHRAVTRLLPEQLQEVYRQRLQRRRPAVGCCLAQYRAHDALIHRASVTRAAAAAAAAAAAGDSMTSVACAAVGSDHRLCAWRNWRPMAAAAVDDADLDSGTPERARSGLLHEAAVAAHTDRRRTALATAAWRLHGPACPG